MALAHFFVFLPPAARPFSRSPGSRLCSPLPPELMAYDWQPVVQTSQVSHPFLPRSLYKNVHILSFNEVDAKPPAAKRSKAAAGDGDGADNDTQRCLTLNEDALSLVLELLAPRDLYAAALTCKSLRAKITVAMIVKSVLIQNGRGKQTLDELQKLLSDKSIHPPSALRLLRLVNGKRCEICNRRKVNHVRPGIGVFSCWTCLTERGLTKGWKKTWVRYRKNVGRYELIFKHPRVAAQEYGKTQII